jgi:Kef-type K+ transport system membrane component KefB
MQLTVVSPIGIKTVLFLIILIGPFFFEKIKFPGLVGLIFSGVIIGSYLLNILIIGSRMELLSTIGLIYLMFNSGLELDIVQFKRVKHKAMVFGLINYFIPLSIGIIIVLITGLNLFSSVLLGTIFFFPIFFLTFLSKRNVST